MDQGCGIAPERLPKLGEPFYSTKEKGTGLGLMVCYRIIEAHGGFMKINSKLEEGTVVEITLPTTTYLSKGAATG
ncbi:Sporulation kinase E [compost metagenome]